MRYVILKQDSIAATVFTRRGDAWIATVETGSDVLGMPEIGMELWLDEIYGNADFPKASAQ